MIDSNIDDRVFGRNNPLQLSKSSILALQLKRVFPFLFWFFGNSTQAKISKYNNSNRFPLGNLLLKLPSNIIPNDLLNLLLNSNNCRL